MKKTQLYDNHQKLNAKFVPFGGWDMPIQYSSVKDEAAAVRKSAGVFDVSHMGEFFVTGKDTYRFLNFILPNEIEGASMRKAVYSPLIRENGTIIDDLIVYKLEDERALVCVNAANIDKDFMWLSENIKNFDCKIENKSEDYSLLALQGPDSEEVLRKAIDADIPGEYYSCVESNKFILARTGYTGEDGFEIFGPHKEIQDVWEKLIELDTKPCGLAARDVLRLEVCYPLYGHELNDEVTPLDSALKWTVKFGKEDFMGKEFLSHYKPKYRLVKLILEKGIPREGYEVTNSEGETIGIITSGTMSVALSRGISLARIEANKFPTDEIFNVKIRNQVYEAKRTTKPFVAGGHK
jgi:aminomethyltransferase